MKANLEQCNIMRLFALLDSQGVINSEIPFSCYIIPIDNGFAEKGIILSVYQ